MLLTGLIIDIISCSGAPEPTADRAPNTAPMEVSQPQSPGDEESATKNVESLAQAILATVRQCGEGLKQFLDQCAEVNQAVSLRALKGCLEAESKEYEGCYAAYLAKSGGMDCVAQNFRPFWDDCKMPCFFHWNLPYLEGVMDGDRPDLPWGKTYLGCLGICAEEYFVKRCNQGGV